MQRSAQDRQRTCPQWKATGSFSTSRQTRQVQVFCVAFRRGSASAIVATETRVCMSVMALFSSSLSMIVDDAIASLRCGSMVCSADDVALFRLPVFICVYRLLAKEMVCTTRVRTQSNNVYAATERGEKKYIEEVWKKYLKSKKAATYLSWFDVRGAGGIKDLRCVRWLSCRVKVFIVKAQQIGGSRRKRGDGPPEPARVQCVRLFAYMKNRKEGDRVGNMSHELYKRVAPRGQNECAESPVGRR